MCYGGIIRISHVDVLGKYAGCALTIELLQEETPDMYAVCPDTLVGVSSSCRNCTSMLHADGFRCYVTIDLDTRDEDRDSFGTVGCRCREPRTTVP